MQFQPYLQTMSNDETSNKNSSSAYEVFLEQWEPGVLLKYASIPTNLNDPLVEQRLRETCDESADLIRQPYTPGVKTISSKEATIRAIQYFVRNQQEWSGQFEDYLLHKGIVQKKIDVFTRSFRDIWVDGYSRRHSHPDILSIKASILEHDRHHFGCSIDEFVVEKVDPSIQPLFTIDEMSWIFEANEGLLEAFLSEYIDYLDNQVVSTFSDIHIRRGVHAATVGEHRIEHFYLSSYSLALGPVEQFSQTWTPGTKESGSPTIFSAPIPAVQKRTVAFSPFITGMTLQQLELISAPPSEFTPLAHYGSHAGINEIGFE